MEQNDIFNALYKIGGHASPMWMIYASFAFVAALVLVNAVIVWRETHKR